MTANRKKDSVVVEWYPIKQAARHAQLSVDMVNYLCRYGIVKPSGCKKRGHGCIRKYTLSDIILLRVISELLSRGVSVLKLRKSLVTLQKRGKTPQEILTKRYLVTDGENVYFKDDDVLELLTTGQLAFAFVLELEVIRKELSQGIEQESNVVAG